MINIQDISNLIVLAYRRLFHPYLIIQKRKLLGLGKLLNALQVFDLIIIQDDSFEILAEFNIMINHLDISSLKINFYSLSSHDILLQIERDLQNRVFVTIKVSKRNLAFILGVWLYIYRRIIKWTGLEKFEIGKTSAFVLPSEMPDFGLIV